MSNEKTYKAYYLAAIISLWVLAIFLVIYGTMDTGYSFEINAGILFVIGFVLLLLWGFMFPKQQPKAECKMKED